MYRVDEFNKVNEVQLEIRMKEYQGAWEQARWLSANFAKVMGAKIQSVYAITTFPWEAPEPVPTEDLLSKFPKTLK